jgi:hypothetical protein
MRVSMCLGGRFRLLLKLVDSLLAEFFGLPFFNCNSVLGAIAQAGTQTVAVYLGNQPGLAVYNLQRPLHTRWYAKATAVALLFIYLDDFSHCSGGHINPPLAIFCFRFFAHKLSPPLFTQALAGGRTPVYAGRRFLPIDHLTALVAAHPGFIGENLNLATAAGAAVKLNTQFPHILPGASKRHFSAPPICFCLNTY